VNTTLIVHVDLAGTTEPQELVCENCAAPVPVKLMLEIDSAPPLLVRVTGRAALATPLEPGQMQPSRA